MASSVCGLGGPFYSHREGQHYHSGIILSFYQRWRNAIVVPKGTVDVVVDALGLRIFCHSGVRCTVVGSYAKLKDKQMQPKTQDIQESPLFQTGDKVWLRSKRTSRRTSKNKSTKLLPRFVGPFDVLQADSNHTYLIEQKWPHDPRVGELRGLKSTIKVPLTLVKRLQWKSQIDSLLGKVWLSEESSRLGEHAI